MGIQEQKRQRRKGQLHSLPLQRTGDQTSYNTTKLWRHLLRGSERGHVMAASFEASSEDTEDVGHNGLMADHCYSILQLCNVDSFHLIQLRNPFGSNIEWNGAW